MLSFSQHGAQHGDDAHANRRVVHEFKLIIITLNRKLKDMFTSVASSCVRHGSRTRKLVTDALILTGLQTLSLQRTHTLFTPAPGYVCRAPAARSVSGSSVCHRDAHLPRAASVDTDQTEDFGSLSTDISSRRLFKKSSPEFQDLKYRDDDALDEEKGKEEEEELARRRPARRNTAYWYHLQCRKLIRDNKVGVSDWSVLFVCLFVCLTCLSPPHSYRRRWICSARTCCGWSGCGQRSSTTVS